MINSSEQGKRSFPPTTPFLDRKPLGKGTYGSLLPLLKLKFILMFYRILHQTMKTIIQQYNEWQFNPVDRVREMTIFLETALISQQYATTENLRHLEKGLTITQYLRHLERIACCQISVAEYIGKPVRSSPVMAYCPIIPV